MVRVRLPGDQQKWSLATCMKQVSPRSYEVLCGDRSYRRNRRDLRKNPEYQSEGKAPVLTDSRMASAVGDVPNIKNIEQQFKEIYSSEKVSLLVSSLRTEIRQFNNFV